MELQFEAVTLGSDVRVFFKGLLYSLQCPEALFKNQFDFRCKTSSWVMEEIYWNRATPSCSRLFAFASWLHLKPKLSPFMLPQGRVIISGLLPHFQQISLKAFYSSFGLRLLLQRWCNCEHSATLSNRKGQESGTLLVLQYCSPRRSDAVTIPGFMSVRTICICQHASEWRFPVSMEKLPQKLFQSNYSIWLTVDSFHCCHSFTSPATDHPSCARSRPEDRFLLCSY